MKTLRIMFVGLLVAGAAMMTGCKKDKPAEEVEGSYKGTLVMSVSGKEQGRQEATMTLKAENEEKATLVIPAMGEGKMSAPEITVNGIQVTKNTDKNYTLEETQVEFKSGETTWKGSLKGEVKDKKLGLEYQLTPGSMPMSIQFVFNM